jgi:Uma2 family endonuclease
MYVQIVSAGHDDHVSVHVTKRAAYAAAGIAQYWIIDPQLQSITVLSLGPSATAYGELGTSGEENRATSRVLSGFGLVPSRVLAAAGR